MTQSTTFVIKNKNIDTSKKTILVFLKAIGSSNDWASTAWETTNVQESGQQGLKAITHNVAANGVYGPGQLSSTATVEIPAGQTASFQLQKSGELKLLAPTSGGGSTSQQSSTYNPTTEENLYTEWSVNGNAVCRDMGAMDNKGHSSFQLYNKIYITVAESYETDSFKLQDWDSLIEIPYDSALVTAIVTVEKNSKNELQCSIDEARPSEAIGKGPFTAQNDAKL